MTSQEAKGSYMRFADVLRYFEDNRLIENLDYFMILFGNGSVEIEGVTYISTNAIKQYMSTSEVRTMECQVTTSIFGLVSNFEEEVWLDQDFLQQPRSLRRLLQLTYFLIRYVSVCPENNNLTQLNLTGQKMSYQNRLIELLSLRCHIFIDNDLWKAKVCLILIRKVLNDEPISDEQLEEVDIINFH